MSTTIYGPDCINCNRPPSTATTFTRETCRFFTMNFIPIEDDMTYFLCTVGIAILVGAILGIIIDAIFKHFVDRKTTRFALFFIIFLQIVVDIIIVYVIRYFFKSWRNSFSYFFFFAFFIGVQFYLYLNLANAFGLSSRPVKHDDITRDGDGNSFQKDEVNQ